MTGRYLVDIQTAVSLAALQMAIEFGPYEMNSMPEENNEDVIEIIRYVGWVWKLALKIKFFKA